MFYFAKMETGDGLAACSDCRLLPTKPNAAQIEQSAAADEEIERLVWEVEQIVQDENAGQDADWTFHNPELFPLLVEWREAERQLKLLFEARQQAFIKAHFEKK